MPTINIKEYDKTRAVTTDYANFTVVVPGYCADGKGNEGFDENDICEVDTAAKFIKYIGKVAGGVKEATAPELFKTGTLTAAEFFRTYEGQVYSATNDETATAVGYLVGRNSEDSGFIKYTKVSDEQFNPAATYYVIKYGKEGNDEVTTNSIGNQIAYELVKLGYTVLFVKADVFDTNKEALKDKATYDFRYICTGNDESLQNTVMEVATARQDCIALIDINNKSYSEIADYISTTLDKADKYTAILAPEVTFTKESFGEDADYNNNRTMPASFYYLACAAYARNELNFKEWYAVAGYTRGVCGFKIEGAKQKYGEAAIQALEPRYAEDAGIKKSVNVIANIRGNYILWGNRTAHLLGTKGSDEGDLKASHFLNIRQLCTTIKKQVYVACRQFTFDPNSDVLWINFCNKLKPMLEQMKADQGISDYRIIKRKVDAKAILGAKIRIVPIEAVEDFDIDIYLEDSISGTSVQAGESESVA